VLAELSLSPELAEISERLLHLNMNGLVLLALKRFQGPESIRMADIFLVKVMMIPEGPAGNEAPAMLVEDCFGKASALLLEIIRECRVGDRAQWDILARLAETSRRRVETWRARPRSPLRAGVGVVSGSAGLSGSAVAQRQLSSGIGGRGAGGTSIGGEPGRPQGGDGGEGCHQEQHSMLQRWTRGGLQWTSSLWGGEASDAPQQQLQQQQQQQQHSAEPHGAAPDGEFVFASPPGPLRPLRSLPPQWTDHQFRALAAALGRGGGIVGLSGVPRMLLADRGGREATDAFRLGSELSLQLRRQLSPESPTTDTTQECDNDVD